MKIKTLRGHRARRRLVYASLITAGIVAITPVLALAQSTPLPLAEALSRTANTDPTASATNRRLAAADANIRQSGVRLNPSIGLEAENFAGSNPYTGTRTAEFTLSYQQPLERKSKRQARVGVAEAEKDLVRAEGRVRTWQAMTLAQSLWIDALTAEAEVDVATERLKLAEQSQTEISRRVDAARDPLFAASLANTDVANARIALDQAVARTRQLKLQLSALWGGGADFSLDPEWLENTSAAVAEPILLETPEIEALRAQQRVATANIRVETARRLQDPTLTAGVRRFRADGATAFLVGGTIPLNRFDNNRGNIERTRAEAEAAATDIEIAERFRQRDITAATIRMKNLVEEVRRIDAEVIPQAEKAVSQVREGFARGGFTYRDVIGAQETLIAARERRVAVLRQFQLDKAERDRLAGQWVPLIPTEANP